MMNNANEISRQTKLFGFIGEHAGSSRFSALINKKFKENQKDMMMIPMNIRADDFFFTLSNMKKSHVNGAIISHEYTQRSVEILDEASALVRRSGMCDIVFREGEKLFGDVFSIRVLLEKLKDLGVTKIALLGTSPYARAFALMACGFQVSYFHDNLEELMLFCKEMEFENPDINRIAQGMCVDFSRFGAVLDFSDLEDLAMVAQLAPYNFDMKNTKEYSSLQTRASHLGAKYVAYDDILHELTAQAYRDINIKRK